MRLAFVYKHDYPHLWKDGLWAALKLLEEEWEVEMFNISTISSIPDTFDFYLGWGAFGSPADRMLRGKPWTKGLCVGGMPSPESTGTDALNYNVLFYETEYFRPTIEYHPNIVHAFGVNTDIFYPMVLPKVWNYISVGAFAKWKRFEMLATKGGDRLAIGEIQKGNPEESYDIIYHLLTNGCAISDMVEPGKLAVLMNMSDIAYVPADINGGGERTVLEARACSIPVQVESDNPKLKELLYSEVYDHHYYANQLKKGIESCL